MIETIEQTDSAGIEYRMEVDRSTGHFRKIRLTPWPSGLRSPPQHIYDPVYGTDQALINVVPSDENPVWFIAYRIRDGRPETVGAAERYARSRFQQEPDETISEAVGLWRGLFFNKRKE